MLRKDQSNHINPARNFYLTFSCFPHFKYMHAMNQVYGIGLLA